MRYLYLFKSFEFKLYLFITGNHLHCQPMASIATWDYPSSMPCPWDVAQLSQESRMDPNKKTDVNCSLHLNSVISPEVGWTCQKSTCKNHPTEWWDKPPRGLPNQGHQPATKWNEPQNNARLEISVPASEDPHGEMDLVLPLWKQIIRLRALLT